jgi:hypothetical protein
MGLRWIEGGGKWDGYFARMEKMKREVEHYLSTHSSAQDVKELISLDLPEEINEPLSPFPPNDSLNHVGGTTETPSWTRFSLTPSRSRIVRLHDFRPTK